MLIIRNLNKNTNVIMTVTRSTSQMRGSEFFRHKQLFLEYWPICLSKNSACWKIKNGQVQRKLSEFSMSSWANGGMAKRIWLFTWVCVRSDPMVPKRDIKNWGKTNVARAEATEDSMWKGLTTTALQGQSADTTMTETGNAKIMSCYATVHVKLVARHWLMC